jgi:hypothetical protein
LIQVRAILYIAGKRCRIVLEDIRGKRSHVGVTGWRDMDLVLHSQWLNGSTPCGITDPGFP